MCKSEEFSFSSILDKNHSVDPRKFSIWVFIRPQFTFFKRENPSVVTLFTLGGYKLSSCFLFLSFCCSGILSRCTIFNRYQKLYAWPYSPRYLRIIIYWRIIGVHTLRNSSFSLKNMNGSLKDSRDLKYKLLIDKKIRY